MTAPRTVAFLTTSLIVGGQERAMVDLAIGLNTDRYRTIAITTKAPGPLAEELSRAGIPVYAELLTSRWDFRVVPRLTRILKREGVDVVYTVGSGDKMFWGRICGRLAGCGATVCSIHKTRSADGSPVISPLNRLIMPLTSAVVAVGHAAADYLHEDEGVPRALLRVIYNGVAEEKFPGTPNPQAGPRLRRTLDLPATAPVIGIVAALRPEKAHEVFLEAAALTAARHPGVHFLIVGDGARRAELETLAAERNVTACVHFLGSRSDVPDLVAGFDVICLSSHPLVETLPISILEGMAAGKPAVVTDVGSLREMVLPEESGLIVPPRDPAALAEAFCWMLDHPDRRPAMGRRAREHFLAHFTMRQTLRDHERLFDELLGGGTRSNATPAPEDSA